MAGLLDRLLHVLLNVRVQLASLITAIDEVIEMLHARQHAEDLAEAGSVLHRQIFIQSYNGTYELQIGPNDTVDDALRKLATKNDNLQQGNTFLQSRTRIPYQQLPGNQILWNMNLHVISSDSPALAAIRRHRDHPDRSFPSNMAARREPGAA